MMLCKGFFCFFLNVSICYADNLSGALAVVVEEGRGGEEKKRSLDE
jgi:hypothetical protein